jgi:hypothetical protein
MSGPPGYTCIRQQPANALKLQFVTKTIAKKIETNKKEV